MIALSAFGDIMVKPADIQQFRFGQSADQVAAERKLFMKFRDGEAPQITYHEQGMFVDRVGVEHIVLHPPDDIAEFGQVSSQHAVADHAPQFVCQPMGLTQNIDKQFLGIRVCAELVVDQVQMVADQPDRRCPDAFELRMGLQNQEELQQRSRILCKDGVVADLEKAAVRLETRRDWLGFA